VEEAILAAQLFAEPGHRQIPVDGHVEREVLAVAIRPVDEVLFLAHPGVVQDDADRDVAVDRVAIEPVLEGVRGQFARPDGDAIADPGLLQGATGLRFDVRDVVGIGRFGSRTRQNPAVPRQRPRLAERRHL